MPVRFYHFFKSWVFDPEVQESESPLDWSSWVTRDQHWTGVRSYLSQVCYLKSWPLLLEFYIRETSVQSFEYTIILSSPIPSCENTPLETKVRDIASVHTMSKISNFIY